jgi:hypothetical protein
MTVSKRMGRVSGVLSVLVVLFACTSQTDSTTVQEENGRTTITDRTGREWDITHAVEKYGMNPEFFNFGIGVGSIPSVDNPVELTDNDLAYPGDNDEREVFGVVIDDTPRAYSVNTLVRHEVFNETFEGATVTYAAVSY